MAAAASRRAAAVATAEAGLGRQTMTMAAGEPAEAAIGAAGAAIVAAGAATVAAEAGAATVAAAEAGAARSRGGAAGAGRHAWGRMAAAKGSREGHAWALARVWAVHVPGPWSTEGSSDAATSPGYVQTWSCGNHHEYSASSLLRNSGVQTAWVPACEVQPFECGALREQRTR